MNKKHPHYDSKKTQNSTRKKSMFTCHFEERKPYNVCYKRLAKECREGNGKFVMTDLSEYKPMPRICLHCQRFMAKPGHLKELSTVTN